MTYIPNTPAEQEEMLRSLGVASIEDLLDSVPQEVRLQRALTLPPALTELELLRLLGGMAERNIDLDHHLSFLGAGNYDHFVPSVVAHLAKRSEFYTSYTPYQPEVSQGMLQAIYEYQTMVCQLTGMDVANASLYDGATATVEAALLAVGPSGRGEVLVSRAVDPQYREVLRTYAHARGFIVKEVASAEGVTSVADLERLLSADTSAVIVQHPNFFGNLEPVTQIERLTHRTKGLFIVAVSEPASLAVLNPPGAYNADVVAAEGLSLGSAMSYGGPALGMFATKVAHMRRLPGRIAGRTVDNRGQTGYVLTLQTREQHIRRERATSNICTNQALLALAATIHLAVLGKQGFRTVGEQCLQKAHYAYDRLTQLPGFSPAFAQPFFDEFALRCPMPVRELAVALESRGIVAGYDVSRDYPELEHTLLVCVTEMHTRQNIDTLIDALRAVTSQSAMPEAQRAPTRA
jgi:glycine dehydrogenase subunit 1